MRIQEIIQIELAKEKLFDAIAHRLNREPTLEEVDREWRDFINIIEDSMLDNRQMELLGK